MLFEGFNCVFLRFYTSADTVELCIVTSDLKLIIIVLLMIANLLMNPLFLLETLTMDH